ncbi:MAG: FAD:protein FMN transferase, partial [Verrucomicrobiota bacterium]
MLRVDQPDDLISFRHEAMATDFFAYLGGHEQSYLKQAAYEAFQIIDDIEGKLSLYQESSDVSRVNLAKKGESVPVSHEFIECIQLAAQASEATSGRFNAFMGKSALAAKGQTLTHFSAEPTPAQSEQPSIQVDAKNRAVQKLTAGSLLDFGGIGKGYALDKARETLDEWEVETGLLSASGSTLLFLKSPNQPWTAAIGESQIEIPDFTALSSS